MGSTAEPALEETARLDLEFRQHLHILRPYIMNLEESEVMARCGAWIERLTRCEKHEACARNRAVFALCYQLSRGMLAPPFLCPPPGNDVDLAGLLADCCIAGELGTDETRTAATGATEGEEEADGGAEGGSSVGAGGSEGTMTARRRGSVVLLPSSGELWVNPATTLSRTECDNCSTLQQTSADVCAQRVECGGGVQECISQPLSTASLSAVTAWVSSSLQKIPPDAEYEARAASLLMKLRDIKQQNTLLSDELLALKQESQQHARGDDDTLVQQKMEEDGVALLRRRLAQATHSRRLLQEAVAELECRLKEVRDIATMELRDAELKHKMESERTRASLTRQLERAAHEHAERLQRAVDTHAVNIREVEERCAREVAEARAVQDAVLRERDALVREKEQEIKRLHAVVDECTEKLQTAARSEEERRASAHTREQALEARVVRAERARVRCERACKARVARARRETQLAECRSQLKLAEQRAHLRDTAARDSEAEVTRSVGALETKYKDIVASVQAAAIKRRLQDQLSLQSVLQSCGLCVTPAHSTAASVHRHHAYDAMHLHPAATTDKHAEHVTRWACGGAERDVPLAAAVPPARDHRPCAQMQ